MTIRPTNDETDDETETLTGGVTIDPDEFFVRFFFSFANLSQFLVDVWQPDLPLISRNIDDLSRFFLLTLDVYFMATDSRQRRGNARRSEQQHRLFRRSIRRHGLHVGRR